MARALEGALGAALVVGLMVTQCGCGSSALTQHTRSARVQRTALQVAADVIEAACTVERANRVLRAEGEQAASKFAGRCIASANVQNAAVEAWYVYVEAVLIAAEESSVDGADLLVLAGKVLSMWHEMVDLLEPYGVRFPAPPSLGDER